MQFMLLMIPKDYQKAPPEFKPDPKAMADMTKFNASLDKAGVVRSVNGLKPPATGARITFDGDRPTSKNGPFAGTVETVGGYWILELESQQEAIDWAKKCPALPGDIIEVRQIAA
ncbi:MAG: YciI family protein [Chitinophagaceae bacterium]|nr:YciI family protein [Rubrivivax sp.]